MQYNHSVTLLSKWQLKWTRFKFNSHPAPWTTIHFPFIFFTSFAAASIASWLIVSKVFLCVTADPPSLMITSKSTLQAMFRPNAETKLTRRSRHPSTGSRPLIDRPHCHAINKDRSTRVPKLQIFAEMFRRNLRHIDAPLVVYQYVGRKIVWTSDTYHYFRYLDDWLSSLNKKQKIAFK